MRGRKAETPLYENKAEVAPPSNKSFGVEVIKEYMGIPVGTIIENPDAKVKEYMILNGFWK